MKPAEAAGCDRGGGAAMNKLFPTAEAKSRFMLRLRAAEVSRALGPDDVPKSHDHEDMPVALIYVRGQIGLYVVDFYEALDPGTDLNRVVDHFLYWLLRIELKKYDAVKPVAELYRRKLAGENIRKEEWAAAAAPARAAAGAGAAAAAAGAYERTREALLTILRGDVCSCCSECP